jgi:hypothetical protein
MRYPTSIEFLTLLAICAVLYGLTLPTPHELRQRERRDIALRWEPSVETAIANQELLDAEVDICGIWSRGTSRCGSEIEIKSSQDPRKYSVTYYSGRGHGGWKWQTVAERDSERLVLADPVADEWDVAFKSFWIVRLGEKACLLPVPAVAEFNEGLAREEQGEGDDWRHILMKPGPR